MFYVFSHTPDSGDSETDPHELTMKLTPGVIHQIDVLFQDGCNHVEFVQIYDNGFQLWPSNRGEKLRGNATVVSFREFHELKPGGDILTAKIWTTLTTGFKEVIIQVGILPKRVIQPISFEELLTAAVGV